MAKLLSHWFLDMPNLKEFICTNCAFLGEELDLGDGPFPKLGSLKKMSLVLVPPLTFNAIMRANNHISELVSYSIYVNECNLFSLSLPNLESFETWSFSEETCEMLACPLVQWPLKSLGLVDLNLSTSARFFQVIQNKFANTLISLELDSSEEGFWEDSRNCRLDLPKLKFIRLNSKKSALCLDFLLPMRNTLEEIEIFTYYQTPAVENLLGTGTGVQFVGFECRMLESNIWTIFSKLNRIEVRISSISGDKRSGKIYYLREDWMMKNV